jgi:pimeloyl-ACP methyl ester carboxylesterase
MPRFDSSGVGINYVAEGSGPAIALVHGFASSLEGNWRRPGILAALAKSGRRAVALDCRGHGDSDKPHDPRAYSDNAMPRDVLALMDHLGLETADLMGYSMGGMISATLMTTHPERFRSVILSGVGDALASGGLPRERAEAIARAMESGDGGKGEEETARNFRIFAERTGNDLLALAAMQRTPRRLSFDPSALGAVTVPVLVLLGEGDTLVGRADKLAAAIPSSRLMMVPGDHLTAVGPALARAALDFLAEVSPVPAA